MARSFSNSKIVSAFVADRFSVALSRRGYAATAIGGAVAGGGLNGMIAKKIAGEDATKTTSSWVPDPKTGYYRPENHTDEIDVAELREIQLKNKVVRRD